MKWAGNLALIRRRRMHIGFGRESDKEGDYSKDLDVGEWIILNVSSRNRTG
jgi:hypothetical protein